MNKRKIALYSITAVAVAGIITILGVVGIRQVVAEVADGNYPSIIENLAAKFDLNPEDVKSVFEETRDQQIASRLDEAVQDGKITEDQKNLILEKMDEVESRMQAINEEKLTAEERRDKMQELQEEIRSWADENDISLQFLMMGGRMMKGMHGRGGYRMMGDEGMFE